MASSRQIRGKRLASPTKEAAPQTRLTVKNEVQADPLNGGVLDEAWEEPTLRTPAPSFEDYKGLERHGVLEHMAPLGHLPSQKLKSKLRYQETGLRGKAASMKNDESKIARDGVNTPEPIQGSSSHQHAESRKPKLDGQREDGDLHGNYEPRHATKSAPPASTTPVSNPPARTNGVSATHPSTESTDKMKEVVVKATKRANDTGNPLLGHAIQHMYEESFHSKEIADLLSAVLSQTQTPEQTIAFQLYIKAAKKAIKHSNIDTTKPVSTSSVVSQSPDKTGRASVTQQSRTLNDTAAPGLNHLSSSTKHNITANTPMSNKSLTNGSPLKEERPAKRLKRTNSAGSASSDLSSVDSQIEELVPELAAATNSHLAPPRGFQAAHKPGLGPRLSTFKKNRQSDLNRPSASDFVQHPAETAADDLYAAKRSKLVEGQVFNDYVSRESQARSIRRDPRPVAAITPIHTPPHKAQQTQSRLRNGTAQRNRRYDDDDDALSSPPSSPGDPLIPPPAGASRGGTPSHMRRNLKPVKMAKIKNSPIKKQRNVTAGVARFVESDISYLGTRRADDSHDHENSDFCASCSGGGKLLCCDGCERAFHFSCLQPPMDPDTQPEGQWLCTKCLKSRLEFPSPPRGVFRELSAEVNGRNPSAFNLPLTVRDYFDGVKTGEEGEYEEVASINAKKSHGGGYEENPNNLKLRDGKDNAVLCFRCGSSSMGKGGLATREIVGCDFCPCSWHLDCLDPPLASAPNRKSSNGKPRHTWMCPAHIDDELLHLDASLQRSSTLAKGIRPPTGRAYRIRRPKNPKIIDIGLRRGFRNNGLIEIDNESSGEEDEIVKALSSSTVRAPEKGIKLDFIDRLIRANAEKGIVKHKARYHDQPTQTDSSPPAPAALQTKVETPPTKFETLPFAERKIALNLAQFAQAQTSLALSSDQVTNLIQTLTAEAPREVEKLAADSEEAAASRKEAAAEKIKDPIPTFGKCSDEEKRDLERLIELATRRIRRGRTIKETYS